MPTIKKNIAGAKLVIYNDDHYPPHIHIIYDNRVSKMTFDGKIIKGLLPYNVLKKIREYCLDNQDFLMEKWNEYTNN